MDPYLPAEQGRRGHHRQRQRPNRGRGRGRRRPSKCRPTKIASGATEQLASDLLPRIPIEEHATPDFVSVETRRLNGFLIGASFEVRYKVKMPRGATIRATTVNGGVSVTAWTAGHRADDQRRHHGHADRRRHRGPVRERRRPGPVRVDRNRSQSSCEPSMAASAWRCRQTAKATVRRPGSTAASTCRACSSRFSEQARRHFEGRLNGGGPSVEVATVNGGITIGTRARQVATRHRVG